MARPVRTGATSRVTTGKMRATLAALVLFLPGCAGIPDYYPTPPAPEPCEVWIVVYPDRTARCVSRERMRRDVCGTIVKC